MFVITDGLTRLLAPILSFSMEELWRYVPGKRDESVHLALFPPVSETDSMIDRHVLDTWEHLLRIRTTVNASLELLRKEKTIGTSLEAKVSITASGEDLALLQRYASHLPMLFIVSDVGIERGSAPAGGAKPELGVAVTRASGVKCERCWRYVSAMSTNPAQPGICDRCQDALAEIVAS
jgi:isoleucyl-tRNA synthetase